MKANIRFADGELVAQLDDQRQLKHADAATLAEQLWAYGITASEVSMVDWHTDVGSAPTSGQKIAIYSRLRAYENAAHRE
jgi:hypothetical protein